jgi:hypothetical protein
MIIVCVLIYTGAISYGLYSFATCLFATANGDVTQRMDQDLLKRDAGKYIAPDFVTNPRR